MTEFKPGDRVEYQNGIEEDPANGTLGTVQSAFYGDDNARVEWDTRAPLPAPGSFPAKRHLRPVKPQKATPKAGDVVRVVLEGRASMINKDEESFHIGWNVVHGDSNHIKSIEIITPAKPSVADLPVGSVIKLDSGLVLVRRAHSWNGTDGLNYTNADIGSRAAFVLLTEAKPE